MADGLAGEFRRGLVGGLLKQDEALLDAGVHAAVLLGPGGRDPAAFGEGLVPPHGVRHFRAGGQIAQMCGQGLVEEGAHFATEGGVLLGFRAEEIEEIGRALFEKGLGHASAMGLRGAIDAGEDHDAFQEETDVAFIGEAHGAVHLHGPFAYAQSHLARPRPRCGDQFQHARTTAIREPCSLAHQRARHLDIRIGVDGAVLQGLKGAERAAELAARAQIVERAVKDRSRSAHALRCKADLHGEAQTIQQRLGLRAPRHDLGRRDGHIVEHEIGAGVAIDQRGRDDFHLRGVAGQINQREITPQFHIDDEALGMGAIGNGVFGAGEDKAAPHFVQLAAMARRGAQTGALQGGEHGGVASEHGLTIGDARMEQTRARQQRRADGQQLAAELFENHGQFETGEPHAADVLAGAQARPSALREGLQPGLALGAVEGLAAQKTQARRLLGEARGVVAQQGVVVTHLRSLPRAGFTWSARRSAPWRAPEYQAAY